MLAVLLVVLIAVVLGELLSLLLLCRRGHSYWKYLRDNRYAHRGYHDKPRIIRWRPFGGPSSAASAASWMYI